MNAANNDKDSNKKILEFIEYLKINGKNLSLDWLKINKDIANGLFLKAIFLKDMDWGVVEP